MVPAAAALLGALLIQVGTNLANDYYDFVRGGDTEDRVGPTRVTQAGIIAPPQVWWGMVLTLTCALLVGVYLVSVGGWPIVWIGLASLVCAVAYTGGPFPLAYHGLGDIFVFMFFGLIAVGGTYWVAGVDSTRRRSCGRHWSWCPEHGNPRCQQRSGSRYGPCSWQAHSSGALRPTSESRRIWAADGCRICRSGDRRHPLSVATVGPHRTARGVGLRPRRSHSS